MIALLFKAMILVIAKPQPALIFDFDLSKQKDVELIKIEWKVTFGFHCKWYYNYKIHRMWC